jgi:hypothetical protein
MESRKICAAILACLLAACVVPVAAAGPIHLRTIVTFDQPVEVPGDVLLAGTYSFRLLGGNVGDRNVVEIYNKDETRLYDRFLAISDYRLRTGASPIITFEKRSAGAPNAITAWFYPGNNFGYEFVYPKPEAVRLAQISMEPVPATPANVESKPAQTSEPAPAKPVGEILNAQVSTVTPSGKEEPMKAEAAPRSSEPTPAPPATASPKPVAELPHTASDLPLIGLIGILSLGGAVALRRFIRPAD